MFGYTMWKCWLVSFILLYLLARTSCQKTDLDSPINLILLRTFRNWTYDTFGKTGTDERYMQAAKTINRTQSSISINISFPCDVTNGRSPNVPDSVHKLRPGDIDVIAAMGDSLTAAAGALATSIVHILIENRGISPSGGGQATWREFLTLPNIIKEFNPNLIGYALGDSLTIHEASQLNVAESGAMSEDTPFMAKTVVARIKKDPRIDLQKHWKFISIMIGGNDFCVDICWVSSPWSILEKHKAHLLQVLRTLRDNLPRTFVALIPPPKLKILIDFMEGKGKNPSPLCYFTTNFECSCMFGLAFRRFRPIYYDILRKWQEVDMEIAAYPEFQKNDFAVVAQPILLNFTLPVESDGYIDMSALSMDCFHGSQKTYALYANGLWNNLLEPVGAKSTNYSKSLFEKFLCPTPERPYLATMLNSKN